MPQSLIDLAWKRAAKRVVFVAMEATVTELLRETGKVLAAIEKGKTVIITEHGKPKAKITPVSHRDAEAAGRALLAIGPVKFAPRK